MKWFFLPVVALAFYTMSCQNNQESLAAKIIQVDKALVDSTGHIVSENAERYINLCLKYARTGADTAFAVKHAMQAAEVAQNIRQYPKAIALYDALSTRFPNKKETAAKALTAKAFVLENNIRNIEQARKTYQLVLDKYPDTQIARSIPAILQTLGKSEQELLEMIMRRNEEMKELRN